MRDSAALALEELLDPGERLLWSGQPRQGLRLRLSDALMIPFSLVWGGFAFFWEFSVTQTKAPFLFKLSGIPFVLVGLYLILGRFFVEARMRAGTFYGVTAERIIIVSGVFSRQTKSLPLRMLSDTSVTERQDGSGTITFDPQAPMMRQLPAGWPGAGQYATPCFDLIDGVREVYNIIMKARKVAP